MKPSNRFQMFARVPNAGKWKIVAGFGVFSLMATGIVAGRVQTAVVFDPATDPSSVCSATSPFAAREPLGEPVRFFEVSVPDSNPLPNSSAPLHVVTQDDVVQLRVGTSRKGSVAMHGIMEAHPLRVDGSVHVRLKTRYEGRFPLHFHGDDGAHFEIAVFQVAPKGE